MTNPSEEIDLISTFKTAIKVIFNFLESLIKLFKISFKNYKTTLILIVAASAVSLGIYFSSKPLYKSELIMVTNKRLGDQTSELLIKNLTDLVENKKNHSTLAQLLGMDNESVLKIKNIGFEHVKVSDSLNLKNPNLPFKISVSISDISILPKLQQSIYNYLKNNKYVLHLEKVDLDYFDNYSVQIEKEIKSLDSLKSKIIETLQSKNNSSGVIINNPIDPVDVYLKELELYNLKLNITSQKKLNNSFEILQDFTPRLDSKTWSMEKFLMVGILIGYGLSLLSALYTVIKKTL